ncbi:C-C motif chemokine 3-like [Caloenas nicobarica]|uniref:C-C motif chemokine 3-like n=1 Tax=Caloenas nicobarica TaxID=187106 RepID=UPI0032B8486B
MKVPTAALATLLLLAICFPAEVQLDDTFFMTCCYSYMGRPIPRNVIVSIEKTSSRCSMPAVILVTKNGNRICADPKAPWVQAYLRYFQK